MNISQLAETEVGVQYAAQHSSLDGISNFRIFAIVSVPDGDVYYLPQLWFRFDI